MADFQEDGYDAATGPRVRIKREGGTSSPHQRVQQGPRDLERSRKRGITEVRCVGCGANCGTTPIVHAKLCNQIKAGGFERERLTRPARRV